MKLRIELQVQSKQAWLDAVMSDFNSFLQDHADCERKASAMAMSLVAKYPNRVEILPELINTAVEELEHFKDVYRIMEQRGIMLAHEIRQDIYVKRLVDFCQTSVEERFMDRLLLASLLETRGAERFKMIYEALEEPELKKFYHMLWASEARHGEIFVKMALNYFDEINVYDRLQQMSEFEANTIENIEVKPALH